MMSMATATHPTPSTGKEQVKQVLDNLPDDSSFEEIVHELAFERMIERGLADSDAGRTISDDEMKRRIESWAR